MENASRPMGRIHRGPAAPNCAARMDMHHILEVQAI
jgi:hypothetical protein